MANEGVIKIKGDTKELIDALDKAGVKFQQLGAHGEKAVHHARTFGQSWEHANNHMLRTVAHATSIAGSLHLAVEMLHEFQAESEKASKAVGSLSMQEAAITRKTGIAPEKVAGYLGAPSPIPRKELTEYASDLASMTHVGRAERGVTEQEFAKAMTLRTRGYDVGEVNRALEKGKLDEYMAKDITKGMTEEQLEERRTQIFENNRANVAEERRAEGGIKNRQAGAAYDAASAGTIFDIWGVKTILGASARLQGTGTEGNGRTGGFFAGISPMPEESHEGETKKAIEAQTDALAPRPTVPHPAQ